MSVYRTSGSLVNVLIESDWNLKCMEPPPVLLHEGVLIESYWNLKLNNTIRIFQRNNVLIESDWNLKRDMELSTIVGAGSINRIRLEFKDYLII